MSRLLIVLLALSVVAPAAAAPKKKKVTDPIERRSHDAGPALMTPEEALAYDPDFALVGEYRGYVRTNGSGRSARHAALHLNGLGDGGFTGLLFVDGLPGDPRSAEVREQLTGRRAGRQVALAGRRFDLLVEGEVIRVLDGATGETRGSLTKVARPPSPTMGQSPPANAVVLFDGAGTEHWVNGRMTADGFLAAGTETAHPWDDFRLHLEFRQPYKPNARGQHRGNSGIYLQSRYEVQVLDSFGFLPAFNDLGALYRTKRPEAAAARPPLEWQTYDIDFRPPVFDAGGWKASPARLTVRLNGVLIHDDVAVPNKTGAGQPEAPFPLPTKFQSHKNPVVYRNVWLVPR